MKTLTNTTLHTLVMEQLSPQHQVLSDEEIAKWLETLPDISKEMNNTMWLLCFGRISGKLITRHIQQISKECTMLLDVLYHYPEFTDRMMPLYQAVVDCLEQIMEHQLWNYGKYLDHMAKMPLITYRKAAQQIETQTAPLVMAMSRYCADKTLQALVIGKMTSLLQNGSGSWHQICYLQKLQKWIMELCRGNERDITFLLKDLLIRANFNTDGFLCYCKTGIKEAVDKAYVLGDQYDSLTDYERQFSTMNDKHKSEKFEPGRPKVRTELLDFIKAERKYILNKYETPPKATASAKPFTAPAAAAATEANPLVSEKLEVSFSVEVLAYFLKLLVKAGVVIPRSITSLCLFITRHFQTPGMAAEGISPHSFNNKYHQPVLATAKKVKAVLQQMLKILNEEFEF